MKKLFLVIFIFLFFISLTNATDFVEDWETESVVSKTTADVTTYIRAHNLSTTLPYCFDSVGNDLSGKWCFSDRATSTVNSGISYLIDDYGLYGAKQLKFQITNMNNGNYFTPIAYYVFDQVVNPSAATKYSFKANTSSNIYNSQMVFIFVNSSGQCQYALTQASTSTMSVYNGTFCAGTLKEVCTTNTQPNKWINSSYYDLTFDYNQTCFSNSYSNTKYMVIYPALTTYYASATTGHYVIDDINISSLTNNNLPEGSITLNKTLICLSTIGSAKAELISNYTDTEGDTIFYSVNIFDYFDRKVMRENKYSNWTNYLDYITLNDSTCEGNPLVPDVMTLTLVCGNNFVTRGSVQGNPMLLTSKYADAWTYTLPSDINNQTSYYNLFGFPYNSTYVAVTAKDSSGNRIMNLTINKSIAGNLIIGLNGVEKYNAAEENFNDEYENYFDMSLMFNIEQQQIRVYMAELDKDYFISNYSITYSDVATIEYDGHLSENFWLMDYQWVKAWGWIYNPVFKSTLDPIYFTEAGTYNLDILVSDEVNQPSSYVTEELELRIYDYMDDECIFQNDSLRNITDAFVRDDAAEYLDSLDIRDKFVSFLYFVFFALLIFFIVMIYKNTGAIKISLSALVSSVICFIFSLLFKSNGTMIAFAILISLSLTVIFITRGEY